MDLVYYKREGQDRWIGPGQVIFQDGKVVFVRHGGTFVRVSPNRLVRAGPGLYLKSDLSSLESNATSTNMMETIGVDNTVTVTVTVPQNIVQKDMQNKAVVLQKHDKIHFKMDEADERKSAVIVSQAGKASGQNKNWYNVHIENPDQDLSVDVVSWKCVNDETDHEIDSDSTESVNAVMIPRNQYENPQCMTAKQNELQKLKDVSTYEVVDNDGQYVISTRWVMSQKGDVVKARLVHLWV